MKAVFNRTTRFLKNIMGLWLIQESRRQWIREGAQVTYADLEREALDCEPFRSLIDPDEEELGFPGDMPGRIRSLCRKNRSAGAGEARRSRALHL